MEPTPSGSRAARSPGRLSATNFLSSVTKRDGIVRVVLAEERPNERRPAKAAWWVGAVHLARSYICNEGARQACSFVKIRRKICANADDVHKPRAIPRAEPVTQRRRSRCAGVALRNGTDGLTVLPVAGDARRRPLGPVER